MPDRTYCYPGSNVLKNKKNITDAKELCLQCGYVFDLSGTSHEEMLNASILSFDKGDNSLLHAIFIKAVIPVNEYQTKETAAINILTSDDLDIEGIVNSYEYYDN